MSRTVTRGARRCEDSAVITSTHRAVPPVPIVGRVLAETLVTLGIVGVCPTPVIWRADVVD